MDESNPILVVMNPGDHDLTPIASTLRKAGFKAEICSARTEILDWRQRAAASPHLAIIDPETPGVDFSEVLSSLDRNTRVLLVADEQWLAAAPEWSFASCVRKRLAKPVRRTTLLGWVLKIAQEPMYRTA